MSTVAQAVGLGMLVMLAGSVPRNVLFAANLRVGTAVPWAVPVMGLYLWALWRYLDGRGGDASTRAVRRASLRANRLRPAVWTWALVTGAIGLAALVVGLRLANRLVALPLQQMPDLSAVPPFTVWALLLAAAPIAGVVEEAGFRGYMQGPIEKAWGLTAAILVTGTMFAVAHLDFTPVLWPYYVAVAALYGVVTSATNSIRPAVVLHTAGNLYSNVDLLLHGQAEWQAPRASAALIWETGLDVPFAQATATLLFLLLAVVVTYRQLAREARASGAAATMPGR